MMHVDANTYAFGDVPGTMKYVRQALELSPEDDSFIRLRGLSVDDDLSFLREFEHVTLARVLIAEYTSNGQTAPFLRRCNSWNAF